MHTDFWNMYIVFISTYFEMNSLLITVSDSHLHMNRDSQGILLINTFLAITVFYLKLAGAKMKLCLFKI